MLPLIAAAAGGGGGKSILKILTNKWVIGGAVILAIILVIYFSGRSAGKTKGEAKAAELEKKYLTINEGDEIPPGYDAEIDARALKVAGEWSWSSGNTDEEAIYKIMESRSPGQLKAISNTFVNLFGQSLREFLEYELDSDEFARAAAPLRFIK